MSTSNFAKVRKFWMIYNMTTKGAPTAIHDDPWLVDNELRRLAEKNPGDIFVILQAVAKAQTVDYHPPKPVLQVKVKAIR